MLYLDEKQNLARFQRPKYYDVSIITNHKQMVHANATHTSTQKSFLISIVDGYNCSIKRRCCWDILRSMHIQIQNPQVVARHFKCILKSEERMAGAQVPIHQIKEFLDCINDYQLQEIENQLFLHLHKKNKCPTSQSSSLPTIWQGQSPIYVGSNDQEDERGLVTSYQSGIN